MKKNKMTKFNNRGASLIAVLIAIVVVGVMGSVVMQLTITNLQMKEVERQTKKNFYTAEEFMGYLTNQINVKSAKQLQDAFNDMLAMYKTASQSGTGLKKSFAKAYLDRMIAAFSDASATPSQKLSGGDVVYEVGYYDPTAVTNLVYDPASDPDMSSATGVVPSDMADATSTNYGFQFSTSNCFYYADYDKGTFTLSNICVFAKDDKGNSTKIQTDLVFHTPDINLDASSVVKEFMRYSLIADDKIDISSNNISVDGNVYAGENGIECHLNNYAEFIGKKIVTRGDIMCSSIENEGGHVFQVGNPTEPTYSQIWANNIRTLKDTGEGAKLNLSGDCYIADDLTVDGDNSVVVVTGAYYGYNYQRDYDHVLAPEDAAYASAVMVNGKNAMIDMYDLTSLMIYGRSFIGRNQYVGIGANDIRMGESISVKSNQIAYYVPSDCCPGGILDVDLFETYSGVDVSGYVAGNGVTEYHYIGADGNNQTSYYLKFNSDQSANAFYFEYYRAKEASMTEKAKRFINTTPRTVAGVNHYSLQFNQDHSVIRGDYLYTNAAGQLCTAMYSIPAADFWEEGKTYFEFAKDHAIRYKSLVLTLEDKKDEAMAGNVRIDNTIDPTLFDNLIDATQWAGFFADHQSELIDTYKYQKPWTESPTAPNDGTLLAIIDNGSTPYEIPEKIDEVPVTGGLVIASGDVIVKRNFKGTIISGNQILLDTANAVIQSDEVLISKMISRDAMLKNNAVFSKLFKGYSSSAQQVMSGSSIDMYMTYDNWTKTME